MKGKNPSRYALGHAEHELQRLALQKLVDRLNELDRPEYDGLRFAADENGWHKAG